MQGGARANDKVDAETMAAVSSRNQQLSPVTKCERSKMFSVLGLKHMLIASK
jgi:hypothetical protein